MFDDIIGAVIGSVIFEAIGASVRWVICYVLYSLQGKPPPSFSEIFKGKFKGKKKLSNPDLLFYGASNVLLGMLTLIGLGFLINAIWF